MKNEAYKRLKDKLKIEYDNFLKTEQRQDWKDFWYIETGTDESGSFEDYLYDFHPEMLK